eukprot:1157726-Pelagomonas_calceolata.AAC.7
MLHTEEEGAARSTDDATAKLEAFCAALQPEIDDDGLARFVEAVPEVMSMPPAAVCADTSVQAYNFVIKHTCSGKGIQANLLCATKQLVGTRL